MNKPSNTTERTVSSMHLRSAITWGGEFGGQMSFGPDKTPKVKMIDIGNGVLLRAPSGEAFVPMENILILLYA